MHSRWLEYVAAVEKNDEELEAAKDMKSYTDPKYKPEKQITEPNVFMIVCVYFFLKKVIKNRCFYGIRTFRNIFYK